MYVQGAAQKISEQVSLWDGVSQHPHRFGGLEFRMGKRELGHIHGDLMLDIPFPIRVRDEIVRLGLAQPHHLLPESGWVSYYIREPQDVQQAISLLRRSYELAQLQKRRKTEDPHIPKEKSREESEKPA
jgi:hypothetical protein